MKRLLLALGLIATACTPMPAPSPGPLAFTVPPTNQIRTDDFEGLTPAAVDGARTISTADLQSLMTTQRPVLIDVLDGSTTSLPGAVLLTGAGLGTSLNDGVQRRFGAKLTALTGGDRSRPIVIYCLSQTCWLSHNAVVRAVAAGFTNVYWYRGGHSAWLEAGLPLTPVRSIPW